MSLPEWWANRDSRQRLKKTETASIGSLRFYFPNKAMQTQSLRQQEEQANQALASCIPGSMVRNQTRSNHSLS